MIKILLVIISSSAMILSCTSRRSMDRYIELDNPSKYDLKEKGIIIRRIELLSAADGKFPLLLRGNDTLPAQLDDTDGDGTWDQLFFLTDLKTGERQVLQLKWTSHLPRFEKRTSIRFGVRQTRATKVEPAVSDTFYADQLPGVIGYQHYQTDGPTWENDKVGFRLYLDGRNSVDVFGKKQAAITPENTGIGADGLTENNYSEMKDWGTDILAVGNSVGIGGVSMLIGDSLARLGIVEGAARNNIDTTICRILSEGPIRSMLQFRYLGWQALNRRYNVETAVSIWPGMHAFKNSVRITTLQGDETLVAGLVNSKTDQKLTEMQVGDWMILYTHDRQTVNKDSWLGLALIVPRDAYLGYMSAPAAGSLSSTYLAKLKILNGQPLDYYAVAAWEGNDKGFRNPDFFKEYLLNLTHQLSTDITLTIR